MRDIFEDAPDDDFDMCDDNGKEYMMVEDHEEAIDDFKIIAAGILKEIICALEKEDAVALGEALDEMAEHVGATI